MIVSIIAAQYGRYSVKAFANASKHFDFHQHTVPSKVKARQNGVELDQSRTGTWKLSVGDVKLVRNLVAHGDAREEK